jgi:hypothetical protein
MNIPIPTLPIMSAAVGAFLFVWFYWGFVPVLALRIKLDHAEQQAGFIKVHLEVENKSRLPAWKRAALLQLVDYEPSDPRALRERVDIEERGDEERAPPWRAPLPVLSSTITFNPGEIIAIEVLCPGPRRPVIHGIFQVQVKLSVLAQLAHGWRSLSDWLRQYRPELAARWESKLGAHLPRQYSTTGRLVTNVPRVK